MIPNKPRYGDALRKMLAKVIEEKKKKEPKGVMGKPQRPMGKPDYSK